MGNTQSYGHSNYFVVDYNQFLQNYTNELNLFEFKAQFYSFGIVLVKNCPISENSFRFEEILNKIFKMMPSANAGDASRDRKFPIEGSMATFPTSSTEVAISLHSELGYVKNPPRYCAFGCVLPASTGGQMVFGDSRKILNRIPDDLQGKITERGAYCAGKYKQDHWETCLFAPNGNIQKAEEMMTSLGWNWEWKGDGSLSWWSNLPAIQTHPITTEKVFLTSTSFLQSFKNMKDEIKRFGDLSEMTLDEFKSLRLAHKLEEFEILLEPGDIVVVDNWLIKHGRRAFQGPRKHFVLFSDSFLV